MTRPVTATCHCGAVSITLSAPPPRLTKCNCSLCRSYGVVWAYCDKADLTILDGLQTDTYAWNGRNVDFHRCRSCGCVTHWVPRRQSRKTWGINANLMPKDRISSIPLRHRDG